MYGVDDGLPTIRHFITKKIESVSGAMLAEPVRIKLHEDAEPPYIAVGVHVLLDGGPLAVRSTFHLPTQFELIDVYNEIDEIAESFKAARVAYWRQGRPSTLEEAQLPGTGMRGRWKR
jgi:hypothetical protein